MRKKIRTIVSRKVAGTLSLAVACVASSFALGMHSAGNVQPVTLIEAGSSQQRGDINGDGIVDLADVALILEISQGYAEATVDQVKADPNEDGALTVDDAIAVISLIESR